MTLGAAERDKERVTERLARTREPLIRLTILAAFVCRTYEQLSSRDPWPQFISPMLRDLLDVSSPTRFEHFPESELHRLQVALSAASESKETEEILSKIEWARLAQALYVADTAYFKDELSTAGAFAETAQSALSFAELVVQFIESPKRKEQASKIVEMWKRHDGQSSVDRVLVLLVVPGESDWATSGVLTTLELQVAPRSQVSPPQFAHMSDDVSAGTVAFDAALQAANRWLARDPHVAARTHTTLRLQDVSGVIDGPSLGLAIAALCVTHTMSQLAMRNQFRIPQNVALTGALDSDGRVHSVDGIPEKITRAFFSPVEYVAVPAGLEKEAAHVIGKLNARYPLRALGVIPLRNLDDLFSQRRLVSDYTVPLPLHIAHQAGRMPRWALTSALIVVLFFVAMSSMWYYYPLTRFWLDKAPVHWDASNGTELIVFNNDMIELWRFRPDLGGVPVEWPALGRDTVENPEGRWFAPMVKGKSAGYKASYSMCKIGDTNGDGVPELFFVPTNRVESLQPSINRTTPVYCLDANGQVLWTHNYDSLDVSPLAPLGTRAIEVRSWNLVDWNNSGKANIVLALVDRHGENPALIEELDGETGKSLARFWHKQWFWDLSVLPRTDDHGIQLWAGTLSQSGYPELYIFRDSLRSRVCPYNDTSGVTLARYPVADVFNNLNKGAWLIAINGRVNAATLHFSNTEIRTPLGNRWRGYNFNIDHSLRWDKHRVPNAWWGEVEQFARAGIIAEPSSPEAWLEPLTYCEIWTGNGWVPADSSRPRPNPPPIFERWNH